MLATLDPQYYPELDVDYDIDDLAGDTLVHGLATKDPYVVHVMRGIPGSGKSTLARQLAPPETICSADDYFARTGEYRFLAHELPLAHAACLHKFIDCLHRQEPSIVVDNTNIRRAHYDVYVKLAEIAAGYVVEFHEFVPPKGPEMGEYVRQCAARNVHSVGANACLRMASIWESRKC